MRKEITPKKERDRFDREVRKMLVEEFGAIEPDGAAYQYRLNTKAGPLDVSIHEGIDSPGNVMTRFEFPLPGQEWVGASVPSGKWNFHWPPGADCDESLDTLRRQLDCIRPTSLEDFAQATWSFIPQAIVGGVLQERGIIEGTGSALPMSDPLYMFAEPNSGLRFAAAVEWFTDHCTQQLIALFDMNRCIRRLLEGDSGAEVASGFVHQWLDGYLDSPPKYRKAHPNFPVLVADGT
jgi:hypothetical protein